ncbi:MAG TPA: hypothetical protein VJW94_09395 [Candidatus Acidoferrum sp.]|nr:hypothetical protein [Candidatus Acidoferrum sp.]
MRTIARQEIDFTALYTQCRNQRRFEARARLGIAQAAALEAAQQYRALGLDMTLYQFVHPQIPEGGANAEDFVGLYNYSFARKNGAGRWAYDKIKASAPHGICPLCGQRPVSTLDHYLPKESKWMLAITPDNLIPACTDCNFAKRAACPQDEATQSFHPYFDSADESQWLFAQLRRVGGGLFVSFFVRDPEDWTPPRRQRARHHFTVLGLESFYKTQAAEELANMKYRLTRLLKQGGAGTVTAHLREVAASYRSNHTNSWQTALYDALAQDAGFCAGDFSLV